MKILLLSDIHFNRTWYDLILRQKVDAVFIAGDLLNGFTEEGLIPQMLWLAEWCSQCKIPLALSSGNHDANELGGAFGVESLSAFPLSQQVMLGKMLSAGHWMDVLERPGLITDGRTALLETANGAMMVTTLPFNFAAEDSLLEEKLLSEGAKRRRELRIPWIVLHHDPPADTAVGGMMGDPSFFYRIREYCPSFVLSGHLHDQPYVGSFADKIDNTWCFNPGYPLQSQVKKAKFPNHILLDLKQSTATWYATPPTGTLTLEKKISL